MRLHRFFIEEHLRNKKEISLFDEDIIHQWKDVFRLRAGNQIVLLDNSGFEYIAEILVLAKGKAELKIVDASAAKNMPTQDLWLFASIIKKDNYEWILEKATEVGVSHFVPVVSDRTEKKDINMERARKIVKEAAEQSGRGTLPDVSDVLDLDAALTLADEHGVSLIAFDVGGKAFDVSVRETLFKKSTSTWLGATKIGILVGPEGGWTERELTRFTERNIPIYSIGAQVLRAETAAIVIPALILFS